MKNPLQDPIGKRTSRIISILLLAVLVMLSNTPAIAAENSLSVVTNKDTYNIGDSIYVSGKATPNASVVFTLLSPSNITVAVSQTQVPSSGNYSIVKLYTLKVTDEVGFWLAVVYDTSSNKTAKVSFEVVSIWDRILILESQLSNLQGQTQALEEERIVLQNDIQTLNSTVGTLSSRLSTAEFSSIFAYGAIAISIFSLVLSIWAVRKKTGFIPKRRR